ncbi:MAG TPA: hypothetical protein DEF51_47240, partial [Myxococcales bacterium]|nr:hypothetical protein [Myxococcales bacterium]
ADAPPELDRREPASTGGWPKVDTPTHQAAAPVDEMQSLLLAAEADDELDELIGAKRRSGRLVAVVSLLIILISLGVIGWVVTRRAAPAETGAAAADDGAPGEVDAPP